MKKGKLSLLLKSGYFGHHLITGRIVGRITGRTNNKNLKLLGFSFVLFRCARPAVFSSFFAALERAADEDIVLSPANY